MAYWWDGIASERAWVEIRRVPGAGRSLICPAPQPDGRHNAWHKLVGEVRRGDPIFHWNAREHRFIGRSIAAASVHEEGPDWILPLERFTPIRATVGLETLESRRSELERIRDRLKAEYEFEKLYLPFQYRGDDTRMISNYFAKFPKAAVDLLFDETGLGEAGAEAPSPEDGVSVGTKRVGPDPRSGFLSPFRPKADSDYITSQLGGVHRRGRRHETLVNSFAAWLTGLGYEVGRNAAIDLGLSNPSVVIEAKIVTTWPLSIRAAVGQLYEYRYFKVADPAAELVFLVDEPVPPPWVDYLERDRQIGCVWPSASTFVLSPRATKALGL